MLMLIKTPTSTTHDLYPPIPDPWTQRSEVISRWPTWPRPIPLDPTHELAGRPVPEVLMPEGVAAALRLADPSARPGAIATLLSDALKLGAQASESLAPQLQAAIALLIWVDAP
ncbi:hypothetical protein [Leptolyngbya iicbica]|uniref:Uncharacterized protein n=2 Tax=Cyanophyceae TaxID=3028117 RepID=A0A4Q7EA44_9CYAN|nr:hypothetical protein [Leptolyngbya sp. LK]RZM79512.1 hypothetical protein DYY88_12385 [Leptolyngbya sp. LK]